MCGEAATEVAGETVRLLPERALYWERARTLLVADLHLGKAAAFRSAAIPVPGGTTDEGLARLDAALEQTRAERLVILGDFFHARAGRGASLHDATADWRGRRAKLNILLVRGNHDRRAGDPPDAWRFECINEPYCEPPFAFRHHPADDERGYVLAGHVHPAVRLRGPARQRLTLPCFWFGPRAGVLPAFGAFTGCARVRPATGDRVFVVADRAVFPARLRL